jgi:ribosomal protein S12 methylthiotransferase accessory factor
MAALTSDPTLVAALEDHDLLYADPKTAVIGLDYLLEPPLRAWDIPAAPRDGHAADLEHLVASLIDVAGDVLYIDVTPDDVRSLKLTVVKAIVPGFQPIHFGAGEFRLGHSRLFRRPTKGGRRGDLVGRDELNLAPHPVA